MATVLLKVTVSQSCRGPSLSLGPSSHLPYTHSQPTSIECQPWTKQGVLLHLLVHSSQSSYHFLRKALFSCFHQYGTCGSGRGSSWLRSEVGPGGSLPSLTSSSAYPKPGGISSTALSTEASSSLAELLWSSQGSFI